MHTHITRFTIAAALIAGLAGASAAQTAGADIKDEIEQSEKAARVFDEIMGAPDKAIPNAILDDARCVGVFPSVVKVAFGIGGSGGRGVVSCRTSAGWSAPAFFNLGGGSIGFQIGAESTDLVMLFMTDDGINSLLRNKLELGADASVSAGPVGRQAGASTDLKLNAQILSYSRSKGLFAGVSLKGAVIQPANNDMRDVYGAAYTTKNVLGDPHASASAVRAFPTTLTRYSARTGS
jgi:lipid-binding SYLF domain-containing protein